MEGEDGFVKGSDGIKCEKRMIFLKAFSWDICKTSPTDWGVTTSS